MIWFLTKSKDTFINRKELPIDNYELYNLPDESQPVNIWQAMLQAAPGQQIKIPADQPNIVKEALLDCMEMLTDQDKYVIDAIIYEQISFPTLGKRMRHIGNARMEAHSSGVRKPERTVADAFHVARLPGA